MNGKMNTLGHAGTGKVSLQNRLFDLDLHHLIVVFYLKF